VSLKSIIYMGVLNNQQKTSFFKQATILSNMKAIGRMVKPKLFIFLLCIKSYHSIFYIIYIQCFLRRVKWVVGHFCEIVYI